MVKQEMKKYLKIGSTLKELELNIINNFMDVYLKSYIKTLYKSK